MKDKGQQRTARDCLELDHRRVSERGYEEKALTLPSSGSDKGRKMGGVWLLLWQAKGLL